jgi:hypothetical protein
MTESWWPESYKDIRDQVKHHERKTFREEYLQFLKRFEIEHDERYIFKDIDSE